MSNPDPEKNQRKYTTQLTDQDVRGLIPEYLDWTHTGQFRDYGAPKAVCQLCGNTGLRYHFLIAHKKTGEAKWIGSQCILNFDLSAEAAQECKERAKKEAKAEQAHQRLLAVLKEVQDVYNHVKESDRRKIRWIIGKYQRRGGFSPSDLAWLFQVMAIFGFVPDFKLYTVNLRSKSDRTEIKQMGVTGLQLISRCLSEAQREKCEAWGIRLMFD